jgi:hypothetical protein
LEVVKVWERMAVRKRAVKKTDMERFILKKLNEGKQIFSSQKLGG